MKYLFAMAIGPVQSFIAAARKTRDLFVGSRIISEVSKAAALEILAQPQSELIFPYASSADLQPNSRFAAVNKLRSIVETDDPRGLADRAREAARRRLSGMWNELSVPASIRYDHARAFSDAAEVLETYAAWTPYGGPERYRDDRTKVEALLEARKTLRAFPAHNGDWGRRKSSLDGGRETVVRSRGSRAADVIRLRPDEELDGVGFLKRFLRIRVRFESTIDLAALPYQNRLARERPEAFARVEKLLSGAGLTPDSMPELLYDRGLQDALASDSANQELLEAVQKLKADDQRDPPYYALMMADGDDMGKLITSLDLDGHRQLSQSLNRFAANVERLLREDYDAMPVFVGGDDLMALVPLHQLMKAAEAARNEFRQAVNAGLSAGIAIVHAYEPLDDAREYAKRARDSAKRIRGKDGLAITVVPRSGAPVHATGKWEVMLSTLNTVIEAYAGKRLSFGFAHELRDLVERTPSEIDEVLPDLAAALAKRKREESPEAIKLLAGRRDRLALTELVDCLLVARKLARARVKEIA